MGDTLNRVQAIRAQLDNLSALRTITESRPARLLGQLCDALLAGTLSAASRLYNELYAQLLTGGARRVTGDLWKDALLSALLETPNVFSALAAQGEHDAPTEAAMRHDLLTVKNLFELTSQECKRLIGGVYDERRAQYARRDKDNIARMSDAAWNGGSIRPYLPKPEPAFELEPRPETETWLDFDYELTGADGEYIADAALEGVYERFLTRGDWDALMSDLWSFHSVYGTGKFIRYKLFRVVNGALEGMDYEPIEEEEYRLQRSVSGDILVNTIRFMRRELCENVLICGEAGTDGVLTLAHELPELRMVLADKHDVPGFLGALEALKRQPLRFIALFDDIDMGSEGFRALKTALKSLRLQPGNVLVYATCERTGVSDTLFGLNVTISAPSVREFIEMVVETVRAVGGEIDYDGVQNACIDLKIDFTDLSPAAARRLAYKLI